MKVLKKAQIFTLTKENGKVYQVSSQPAALSTISSPECDDSIQSFCPSEGIPPHTPCSF